MDKVACKGASGREEVELSSSRLNGLRRSLRGRLVCRGGADYGAARQIWNGMIDRQPALIARCRSDADVVACVNFVRENGLLFSVRGGGHNVAGLAVCDGGVVIDLSEMRGVRVDADARTVRAEGGATLGDLDGKTQPFGLAVPAGVVSATGVGGLSLHGGLGWLTRKYGTTSDNILSVEIVTADGCMRRASADENTDLYWAVRGGGGGFGVVTGFEFQAYPVGPDVTQVMMLYPIEQAREGLQRFRDYMPDAPEELGLLAVLWTAPDAEPVPTWLRGRSVLVYLGCYSGDGDAAKQALGPLLELGEPALDMGGPAKFIDVQRMLDEDYPDGRLYYWKSAYVNALDDDAIDLLLEAAASRPSPLTSVDVWALGGAFGRMPADATAFGRRDAPFLLGIESNWDEPHWSEANIAWARGLYDQVRSRFDAGVYLNFPGFVEEGQKLIRSAYGCNCDRLAAVKARYDPENLFRRSLHVAPATSSAPVATGR